MLSERQHAISFLARKNRGKAIETQFLEGMGQAIGKSLGRDCLETLVATDEYRKIFQQTYRNAVESGSCNFHQFVSGSGTDHLVDEFDRLLQTTSDEFVLITKQSEYCGGVKLKGSELVGHSKELIKLDGDSLILISTDQTKGVLFDWNRDDPIETYELSAWGWRNPGETGDRRDVPQL